VLSQCNTFCSESAPGTPKALRSEPGEDEDPVLASFYLLNEEDVYTYVVHVHVHVPTEQNPSHRCSQPLASRLSTLQHIKDQGKHNKQKRKASRTELSLGDETAVRSASVKRTVAIE